ncbi:hypothetical protein HBO58_07425, partial [Campylobacter jejuni]
GEVLVVLFEIGDFSPVEKSFSFVKEQGCELFYNNSPIDLIKFQRI